MVKANAYGHGAVAVAKTVGEAGADCMAVATFGEALELRNAGITFPILILGPTPLGHANLVIRGQLSQTLFSYDAAKRYSQLAQ